ncbi:CTP synthase [Pseudothermotoga thermarum]|uniref:CTP synthase n=1 Tax=Pseudothermotoga thermarum DSM 5069 TaxID=688269 RepID=F7YWP9_9THEM|nr:CTP synthase [Pseudothermotoga thermarum]AEH52039.1 CTP synthase [Pseudothermotoga thermarum DSM 5069]
MKKYIVVTGGVLSGVGKGIFSASLARLLKECGLKINVLKIDPYLNVDAGTMNPNQHGEVFVTEDGYEADLDLGHYERFLGEDMKRTNNLTAGQIYSLVVQKEREGSYLGSTVQIVPHVTGEIKKRIEALDGEVNVVEIGGTVGDIESEVFLESVRQLALEKPREDFMFIHVTYVPYLKTTREFKTKPTQQSVQLLRRSGINPNMIVVRSEFAMNGDSLKKVALFGGVPQDMVINLPDVPNVYSIVELLYNLELHKKVAVWLKIDLPRETFNWDYPKVFKPLKIALVAKYLGTDDAYKSIVESILLSGASKPTTIDAEMLEEMNYEEVCAVLEEFDGLIIPGGFGKRGIEGKIKTIQFAREHKKPILGICLGMQLMVVEFARNVAGLKGANSTEFDPDTPHPVVTMMEEQKKIMKLGGTMRLGSQEMTIFEGTKLYEIYKTTKANERHRHRYEVNYEQYKDLFKFPGESGYKLTISAMSQFVEAIELEEHPYFIGVQYHPEFKSKVGNPHPLFKAFVDVLQKGKP